MRTTPDDAFVGDIPRTEIAALAKLYDRFAHPLDPFSEECAEAESTFIKSVSQWYDGITIEKPTLHEFTKGVIRRCRKHLRAGDTPTSINPLP